MIEVERGYTAILEKPLSSDEFDVLKKVGRIINQSILLKSPDGIQMTVMREGITFFSLKEHVYEHIQRGVSMIEAVLQRVLVYTTRVSYCRRTYAHRAFSVGDFKQLLLYYECVRRCVIRISLPCHRGRCLVFCNKMVMYCVCNDHTASVHMNEIMMNIGRVLGGGD